MHRFDLTTEQQEIERRVSMQHIFETVNYLLWGHNLDEGLVQLQPVVGRGNHGCKP